MSTTKHADRSHGTSPRRRGILGLLGALVIAPALLSPLAASDGLELRDAVLPQPNVGLAAAWAAGYAYTFSGETNVRIPHIYRYDPVADEIVLMGAQVNPPRTDPAAISTGNVIYLFGGDLGPDRTAQILRYDPATDAITGMGASLPFRRTVASAVWDPRDRPEAGCPGGCAYVFGGVEYNIDAAGTDQIVRYNPTNDQVSTMASLPSKRSLTAAVFDGTHAYVFGGYNGAQLTEVVRYDPVGDVAQVVATMPQGRSVMSAAWDAGKGVAYLFGGYDYASNQCLASIVQYDPRDASFVTLLNLPSGRFATRAAWDGARAHLFGGNDCNVKLDDILMYTPVGLPGAPTGLTATAGPGKGEISLTWTAPANNGGDPIDNYRVYRDGTLLTELGNVLSHTDTGLANGATHTYTVSAKNLAGEGAQSTSSTATTYDVPSAPASMTATAGPGKGEISLTWTAPASNGGEAIDNYRVYRDGTLLTELGNVLSHTDAGLANGATHTYTVSAKNLAGEGPQSASASATTFDVPSAPRNLTGSASVTFETISLAWEASLDDGGEPVDNYRVYRSKDRNGSYTAVANVTAPALAHDDTPATFDGWWYHVTAWNLAGESVASNTVCVVGGDPAGMTYMQMQAIIEVACTEV